MVSYEFDPFSFVGTVNVNNDGQPLLPFQFQNIALGLTNSVTLDGTAGADTLVYGGIDEVDEQYVDNTGRIINDPISLPVDTTSIEDLVLLGRGGNDLFTIVADHPFESIIVTGNGPDAGATPDAAGDVIVIEGAAGRMETIKVTPNPYVPTETYIENTGVSQDRNISSSGVERIYYLGAEGNDTLEVDPGQGSHSVRVDAGRGMLLNPWSQHDRITTDSLPQIYVSDLLTLQIEPDGAGSVEATFVTGDLTQATNYYAVLDGNDTLVIEGNDGSDDNYTVTRAPAPGSVQITDNAATTMVTETSGALGRLQINTLGGDDSVTIDNSGGNDLITTGITFDGGVGSDELTIDEDFTDIVDATYMPGPAVTEGRLTYDDASDTMVIDFVNLEPVFDLVVATNFNVMGTNADNAINYGVGSAASRGLISVDAFETVEFANKTNLYLYGMGGDDIINLNNPKTTATTGVLAINVLGGDPTASDQLIVNGSAADDAITFTPTGADSGTVAITNLPTVTFATTESLVINAGGNNDDVTVDTTNGTDTVTVTPGATIDSGNVRVDSLVPMDFVNLGSGGTLTIDDPDVSAVEELVYMGTAGTDTFVVDSVETIKLNNQIDVITDDIEEYTFKGLGGDDTFDIDGLAAVALTRINVEGDEPGSGSDTLDYTSLGATIVDFEVTLGLETGLTTITDAGAPIVVFSGVEAVDVNANTQTLEVEATDTDDVIVVRPIGMASATVDVAGQPLVTATTVSGVLGAFLVDSSFGSDAVTVEGNEGDNTITVHLSTSSHVKVDTLLGVDLALTAGGDSLSIAAGAGDDEIMVTPDADIPIFIDGGDPIAASDTLIVDAGGAGVDVYPGPESDEGGIEVAGTQPISFDHIEDVTIDNAGVATIWGTSDGDEITVSGTGADSADVWVNAQARVTLNDLAGLNVYGHAGDDRFDIDVNELMLPAGSFIIDGNVPSGVPDGVADEDVVTLTGADPTWTPLTDASGQMNVDNQRVDVNDVENVIYDGENATEDLNVILPNAVNVVSYEFDPFSFVGTINVNSNLQPLLPFQFQNIADSLGGNSVILNGGAGDDTLVYGGIDEVDQQYVYNTGRIVNEPISLPVDTPGIEDLMLLGRGGNDLFTIAADHPFESIIVTGNGPDAGATPDAAGDVIVIEGAADRAERITVTPNPWVPTETYIEGTGTTQNRNISNSGVERIYFVGTDDVSDAPDDVLVVDPGQGSHSVRVDAGRGMSENDWSDYDRINTDSLPQIYTSNLLTLQVGPDPDGDDAGSVEATFVTGDLTQAENYHAVLDANDTLVIEGNDGSADTHTARVPLVGSVEIADAAGATVTETSGALGRLQINTLGGDDLIEVDTNNGLIRVPITVDGGANSDTILVYGNPAAAELDALDQVEYMPGPDVLEGRLLYDLDWTSADTHEMVIDFVNLEPVIDFTAKTVAMTVYGTNADNAINYTEGPNSDIVDPTLNPAAFLTGMVSVDGFETIEFANFVGEDNVLEIIALAGDDVISVDSATEPDGLDRLWVEGNDPTASDKLIVTATAGDDTITYRPDTIDGGRVTVNTLPFIDFLMIEDLAIDGISSLGSGDDLVIDTTNINGTQVLTPGATFDSGMVDFRDGGGSTATATPLSFEGLGEDGTLTFTDTERIDTLIYRGTDMDDVFDVDNAGVVLLNTQVPVYTPGIAELTLAGLEGDDTFNVVGDHPFDEITVEGGDPSASDILNFTSTDDPVTVDLEAQTVTEAFPVVYSGIEVINVVADQDEGDPDPIFDFLVTGTDGIDEDVTVTVYDASSGKVELGYAAQRAGQVATEIGSPVIYYNNVGTGTTTADFDLGDADDQDTLIVIGSTFGTTPPAVDAPQVFDVNVPGQYVSVDDDPTDGTLDGLVTWATDGIESLEVWGLEGDDQFDVTAGVIPVFIDGGDPIGTTAGDLINILAGGDPVVFEPGPESDEGGFIVGAHQRISFDHIEALGAFNAAKAIIIGTADDDEITIIARDESTHPALVGFTPGEQDFTTTVNEGPEILWVDTPLIFVDANSGDDDITIRTPAPNLAQWGVEEIFVAGGPASTPELGDRLRVETPYEDNDTVYQPTAPDAGIMWIYNTSRDLHTTINIGTWDLLHGEDPDPVLEYHSSPGGVETLLYDGISAEGSFYHDNNVPDGTTQLPSEPFVDTLTILGDGFLNPANPEPIPADELFTHTPGNAPDAGTISVVDLTNNQTMLGISYNNIGVYDPVAVRSSLVTIDGIGGTDTLTVLGTDQSDVMEVDFDDLDLGGTNDDVSVLLSLTDGLHVPVESSNVENFAVETLAGDDLTTVESPLEVVGNVSVLGDGPSGSDLLQVIGVFGTNELFDVIPVGTAGNGAVVVSENIVGPPPAVPIVYSGIEDVHLFADAVFGDDDDIMIHDDTSDNLWVVDNGTLLNGTRVQIDARETFEFFGFNDATLENGPAAPTGIDTFEVHLTTAPLGLNGIFTIDGSGSDTLRVIGTDDPDMTTLVPGGGVQGTVTMAGNPLEFGGLTEVDLVGLSSDDIFNVTPLADVEVFVEGGDPVDNDVINLTASGDVRLTQGTDALTGVADLFEGGEADVNWTDVFFVNVNTAVPDSTLTVRGTNDNDTIAIQPRTAPEGRVWINDGTEITFNTDLQSQNYTLVDLHGRFGNDFFSITPINGVDIIAQGMDPTASDTAVVNGTVGQDTIDFTPDSAAIGEVDQATVQVNALGLVTLETIEHVTINGLGGDDTLDVNSPAADNSLVEVTPGSTIDSGDVQVDALVPMSFTNLGATGMLTVTDAGGSGDELIYNGTSASDAFVIPFAGGSDTSIGLNGQIQVDTADIESYLLRGLGGDDTFDVTPPSSRNIEITIEGDGPRWQRLGQLLRQQRRGRTAEYRRGTRRHRDPRSGRPDDPARDSGTGYSVRRGDGQHRGCGQ